MLPYAHETWKHDKRFLRLVSIAAVYGLGQIMAYI